MTDLYLPGPIRLALGHKRLRAHMLSILNKPEGTTIFDLGPGSLPKSAWFTGMPTLATVLQRQSVAGIPVPLAEDGEWVGIGKFLLRQGMTPAKMFGRYLHAWDVLRKDWLEEADGMREWIAEQRDRFEDTGLMACDPNLGVAHQPVAADVTVVEVLDLLENGEIPLNRDWREWLETVEQMDLRAISGSDREARLRWHVAETCQRVSAKVREALEYRIGLEGAAWTLEQCSRHAGISRERVRQVEESLRRRIASDYYLSDSVRMSRPRWRVAA